MIAVVFYVLFFCRHLSWNVFSNFSINIYMLCCVCCPVPGCNAATPVDWMLGFLFQCRIYVRWFVPFVESGVMIDTFCHSTFVVPPTGTSRWIFMIRIDDLCSVKAVHELTSVQSACMLLSVESSCLLSRAMDDHIVHHCIVSSCQSAATSKIVKHCLSWVHSCKQRYSKYPDLYLLPSAFHGTEW